MFLGHGCHEKIQALVQIILDMSFAARLSRSCLPVALIVSFGEIKMFVAALDARCMAPAFNLT